MLILAVVGVMCVVCSAQTASTDKTSFEARTAGLERRDGFIPYYWDEKKGDLLFELSPATLSGEFLYFNALGSGIGSTEMFADRSSFSGQALCRFRRVGMRVLVIEENTKFRALNGTSDLARSIESSFPTSILASLPIEAEKSGTVLVDAHALLVRDAADLLSQLKRPTRAIGGAMVRGESSHAADWRLDEARSVVDLDHTGSFPLNTEVEVMLTFSTDSESELNQPNTHALSLREHHSFVALPAPGFQPREADPRVGFFGVNFQDFSQPFDKPLDRMWIARWRLEKKNPGAAVSEPVKPIVLYLDRAIPEPVRSAARRGALWWNTAFEQAGFKNALRIEDLPENADPLDIRYPTIQWTNRSGRGWSVGMTHIDPRTGEIIHGVVQLDSHRMRTVNNYWQSAIPSAKQPAEPTFDSFAAFDGMDPEITDEQAMVNRLALLTCHEVGHVLGLDHNFVASTYGRGSVMDYFAPRIRMRPDGSADLSDAYMQGVGSYDRFAIEWGYSEGKRESSFEQERSRLDAMVKGSITQGVVWGNYDDPRWNAYDDGPDPVTWLKAVLPVRNALLARYGSRMLRQGEPASDLAARFPLVYLFHRYALASAINVIGSAKIPLTLAGDGQDPIVPWPADSQREAVQLVLQALNPYQLDVPAELWQQLAAVENRDHNPERFTSSAGYLFSPQDGARSVAEIVVGGLLNPERMQRLATMSTKVPGALSPAFVIDALVRAGFSSTPTDASQRALAEIVRTEIAERLMALAANPEATPEAQAAALAGVHSVQSNLQAAGKTPILQRLDREIKLFLEDPVNNTPKIKPSGAPPGPPV